MQRWAQEVSKGIRWAQEVSKGIRWAQEVSKGIRWEVSKGIRWPGPGGLSVREYSAEVGPGGKESVE